MEYDIEEGATLGRGDVEIHLEDAFASTRHARLSRQGGIVVLEDLGSTNGTYLNEELLHGPQPLHRGDTIRIGDSIFTYEDA
jgi:pSer/pThr/pTyr-binding forkhead associated (FHA) protein